MQERAYNMLIANIIIEFKLVKKIIYCCYVNLMKGKNECKQ